jgi:DNA-binding MarR family transcriptional regulator
MSIQYMNSAWALSGISVAEKLLLLKLADRANDDGECFPGQAKLAEHCSMSERALRDNLKRLADRGLIEVEHRNHGSGRKTNVYRLLIGSTSTANKCESRPAESAGREAVPTGRLRHPDRQPAAGRLYKEPSVKSNLSEEQDPPTAGQPGEPTAGIQFDPERGIFCGIPDQVFARWEQAFPGVDIDAELVKAEAWYQANPRRRKKNTDRFITNWLASASKDRQQASLRLTAAKGKR